MVSVYQRKTKKQVTVCHLLNPAGDGAQDVQWTSVLRRPKRSEDLEPWFKERSALERKKVAL